MSLEKPRGYASGAKHATNALSPRSQAKANASPRVTASPHPYSSPGARHEKKSSVGGGTTSSKETFATPVKDGLISNITPRSSSRKARAESASPTPNGHAHRARPLSTEFDARDRNGADPEKSHGLGISSPLDRRRLHLDGSDSGLAGTTLNSGQMLSSDGSTGTKATPMSPTMFFHADDIQDLRMPKKPPENILSTGRLYGQPRTSDSPDTGAPLTAQDHSRPLEEKPKFFRANEATEYHTPSPRPFVGLNPTRQPLQTIYSPYASPSPPRASSPLKEEIKPRKSSVSQPSSKRNSRLFSNSSNDTHSKDMATRQNSAHVSRRSSVNASTTSAPTSRARSSSLQSAGVSPPGSAKKSTAGSNRIETRTSDPGQKLNGISLIRADPLISLNQQLSNPLSPSVPHSPTKSQNQQDSASEYAANARRERKVLDLEISNSSLLAINRTLEREMRKQTAELRRLRRMTRFSLLSSPSTASARDSTPDDLRNYGDLDGLTAESESEDDRADDSVSARSSTLATSLCSSPTDRTASARFKDPKRQPLDLSGQKTLLIESQKLNQSIDRCLNQTNSLLNAGREALESQQQENGNENLGPKVLAPDENEDDSIVEPGKGLLSPTISPEKVDNPWEQSLGQIMDEIDKSSTLRQSSLDLDLAFDPEPQGYSPEDETVRLQSISASDQPVEDPTDEERKETEILKDPDLLEQTEPQVLKDIPPASPSTANIEDSLTDQIDSFEASLDGLDDDSDSSPSKEPKTPDQSEVPKLATPPAKPSGPSHMRHQSSPSRNVGAAANAPGNRSSMQTLGYYFGLESLSIFGRGKESNVS